MAALTIQSHRDELIGSRPAQMRIGGQPRAEGAGGAMFEHVHPATGEVVGLVPVAGKQDVDDAVRAASASQEGWASAPLKRRAAVMRDIATVVRAHQEELARLRVLDNGIPVGFGEYAYPVSVEIVADIFDHHAGWVDKLAGEAVAGFQGTDKVVITVREPVGVVRAIIPWNAPLMLFAQKVAPALAAGCTVVVKASEYGSFAVSRLVELMEDEAALPAGVVNLVTGPGEPTGESLIQHPGIDKLSFTGSRPVGEHVMRAAADGVRRVSLELGGKSPAIVFDDAPSIDLAAASAAGMVALGLSGQGCVCHTRALVHQDVFDDFVSAASNVAAGVTQGNPFDPAILSGPLITRQAQRRVRSAIDQAVATGAEVVVGGGVPEDQALRDGNFVTPTILLGVDNASPVAQTELFGPVLVVIPFRDESEALEMANDTPYGLGGTVFTRDGARALRVARAVRAGTIGVNGYMVEPHVPFGGMKASGMGREGGRTAVEAYTELKTIMLPTTEAGII